jgi:hypothetical protein
MAALLSQAQVAPKPQDGLISAESYTNAFFGFSIRFPRGVPLKLLSDNGGGRKPGRLSLFAANSQSKGYPVFVILADEVASSGDADLKSALGSVGAEKIRKTTLGGRDFAMGQSSEKSIHEVFYATAANGYILYMSVFAYDKKVMEGFQRCIEAIEFFDPATAKQHAGPDSQPYEGPRHASE